MAPYLYGIEYHGFLQLILPIHIINNAQMLQCKMYFGTKLSYYGKLLSGWALLVVGMSGVLFYV